MGKREKLKDRKKKREEHNREDREGEKQRSKNCMLQFFFLLFQSPSKIQYNHAMELLFRLHFNFPVKNRQHGLQDNMPILTSQTRTTSGGLCSVLYPECRILNFLCVLIQFLLCVLLLKLAKVVFLPFCICIIILDKPLYMINVVYAYFIMMYQCRFE